MKSLLVKYFFYNDTSSTEIYTLSLHDALPISSPSPRASISKLPGVAAEPASTRAGVPRDRKSTRLNSSHVEISYAVFCLKKKKLNTRRVDPNFCRRLRNHRQLNSFQNTLPYG